MRHYAASVGIENGRLPWSGFGMTTRLAGAEVCTCAEIGLEPEQPLNPVLVLRSAEGDAIHPGGGPAVHPVNPSHRTLQSRSYRA